MPTTNSYADWSTVSPEVRRNASRVQRFDTVSQARLAPQGTITGVLKGMLRGFLTPQLSPTMQQALTGRNTLPARSPVEQFYRSGMGGLQQVNPQMASQLAQLQPMLTQLMPYL